MQSEMTRYEMNCPYNGEICCDGVRADFKKNDKGVVKQCRLWTAIKGKNPQGEDVIDFFDCAHAWVPVVTLEASQMTRQNTATMQDFRNDTHEGFQKFATAIQQAAIAFNRLVESNQALIEGVPLPSLENKENNGHDN